MKKLLLISLLFLTACTDHLSKADVNVATCICQKHNSKLSGVSRIINGLQISCDNGSDWLHPDDYFTVGCSDTKDLK